MNNKLAGTKNSLPQGSELLKGLYLVQDYIEKIGNKMNQFWQLERQYRNYEKEKIIETIGIETVKEKIDYGLFNSGIAFCLVFGLIGALSGNFANLIFCLIITVIFSVGKAQKNKKFLTLGKFFLILLFILWIKDIANSFSRYWSFNKGTVILSLIINVIAFIVAFRLSRIVLKKYNRKIEEKNQANLKRVAKHNQMIEESNNIVSQKRQILSSEITVTKNQMLAETSEWYPVDYYSLESVTKFISIVKNHEADTIKEMLAIYKQDVYRTQTLDNQNVMIKQIEESLYNQQEMIRLQRISNTIQMVNCVANIATASNTSRIASNTSRIAANSDAIRANTAYTAENASAIRTNTKNITRKF